MTILLGLLAGCTAKDAAPTFDEGGNFYLQPLAVQQARAYGETVTGRFVSLVDFELDGDEVDQTEWFTVTGAADGQVNAVFNTTRTGAAAMQVDLPAGGSLVFRSPHVRDLRPYTLLSLAVHMWETRDDLEITLTGPLGVWRSPRRLVTGGWNTVQLDLTRIARSGRFELSHFDTIALRFTSSDEVVTFVLDDIMLINNRRTIPGTPADLTLTKAGLDYTIALPGRDDPLHLRQGSDGLWRLGRTVLQLLGDRQSTKAGENLAIMGDRRVGRVELLETNGLRVRLANTWYFPPRPGQWLDLDIRQVRWEYTFYADGRWVTDLLVNNAGGEELTGVRIDAGDPVGFSDGTVTASHRLSAFDGLVGQSAMLTTPADEAGQAMKQNFAAPAEMKILLGKPVGKTGGFDHSEGCYVARATGGNCRIELTPTDAPLERPIIKVLAHWAGPVAANCDGIPLEPIRIDDQAVAVVVPFTLTTPAVVEFTGPLKRMAK